MLCPRCASNQSDEVKFCKFCGANLQAVREALESREAGKKFDWSDTWVAEMFMSGEAAERRKLEMERRMGITPEVKRYKEVKAGVITSSVGVGVTIFLFVFMQGLLGSVSTDAAEILRRLWIVGVIPFLVGVALIINGLVVSRKLVEIAEREQRSNLPPADADEFIPANFSVTEQTTRHLKSEKDN